MKIMWKLLIHNCMTNASVYNDIGEKCVENARKLSDT